MTGKATEPRWRARRGGLLCTSAILLVGLFHTGNVAHAQTISGIGARECSAFNFAVEKDSVVALDSYVAWAQGFISAFNWANVRQQDVRIDSPAIIGWLAEYCGTNTTAPVYHAVQELIRLNAR